MDLTSSAPALLAERFVDRPNNNIRAKTACTALWNKYFCSFMFGEYPTCPPEGMAEHYVTMTSDDYKQ